MPPFDPQPSDDAEEWSLASLIGLDRVMLMRIAFAYMVASAGAVMFTLLALPLPIFLGSLTLCMIVAIARGPIERPKPLSVPMRAVLGVAVGAAFTPELVPALPGMALSLALLVPYTIALTLAGVWFFERFGYDRPTAFFSAVPGGLTDMVTMGAEAGGDQRAITLIHATRIAFLVFAVPFAVQLWSGVSVGGKFPSLVHVWEMRLVDAIMLVALAYGGWRVARALGMAGAALVGPMIASGLLHVAGVTEAKVPFEVLAFAQLTLGIMLGCQFRGLTLREFSTTMVAAIAFSTLLLVITGLVTVAISALTGFDRLPVLLAYAPGGQTELNLLALVLNIDVAFTALHHLVRLAIVIIGAQMVFAARKDWRAAR